LLPLLPLFAPLLTIPVVPGTVGAAVALVGAAFVVPSLEGRLWPFWTRLKNCVPPAPVLCGGGVGAGAGSTGRAMAGNAVILILSSEGWSASHVPNANGS
jgi:hypothetical protein